MEYNNTFIEKFTISKLNVSIILIQPFDDLFNINYDKDGYIEISHHVPYLISKIQTIHLANKKLLRFIIPSDVNIMSISKLSKQKTKLIIYKDNNFEIGYNEKLIPVVELMKELPGIKVKSWVQPRYPLPEFSSGFNFDDDLDLNL